MPKEKKQTPNAVPSLQSTRSTTGAIKQVQGIGQVHFWQGGSLWLGSSTGRTDWHDHHAIQITLALKGDCAFRDRVDGDWKTLSGSMVRAHRAHQFESRGATVAHIFVEPESAQGRALQLRPGDDAVTSLSIQEHAAMAQMLGPVCRKGATNAAVAKAAQDAINWLANTAPASEQVDARIQKAITYVKNNLRDAIALRDAASAAALSPSRFRHLFMEQTGSAFRVYVLWLRLNVAIETAMTGKSWTEAAHQAGFTDSAHLTRTFKRMFGISPTTFSIE
jgi:AraC family transcriptional regulator